RIKVALVDAAGIRGPVRHGTALVTRRDLDRTRPLREREQVAPGAVIEPTEVAPDDHSVRAARWRGRGDVRRPGLSRTVPEERAARRHEPDPGSEVRRCLGYRAYAQRDVVALRGRERPRIKVALVDAAGIRGPVRHGTALVTRRDLDRTRPLREREQVAPGAVIEPTEVAPDDHSVRAARWRGRGDVRRPGLSRTVPEERAARRHQPDPGRKVRRCLGYRAHAQRDVVTLRGRERPRIKVALVDAAGIRGPVRHGTAFVTRRDLHRARPLREREPVAPGAVIEPTEVAPDDHGVRAARWRGRGDVRRPGLSRTVPEEPASRGHQPDPGREVRRCLGYRAHAQRDVVTLRGRERPRIKVALVDAAGIRGPVRYGTAFVTRRDLHRARPLREREPVAPGAVIEPTEVAPDDHGVRAARWRGRGDVRRPGLSRTVPEEPASRGHQPDPGREVRRCLGYRAHAQRDVVTLRGRERPRIKVALVDAAGIRGPVRYGTAFVTRRDLHRARPLREREPVAPGAVIEPTEVAPDDHGVRAARWRGRGDVRRPGLSRTVPEEHASRGHQPDPGREVRRCLGYRAHAQRDVVTLRGRERPRIKVALVDVAGIRGPVRHGTAFVTRRDDDRARPLREREPVAPDAVLEPTEVAPDDHGVRAARWRGRGDVRRPGLSRTVPEEHASRGHEPDPGSEVRRCLGYRAHAQRDVVTLRGCERPRIKVALVDAAGIRGPVRHGTALVTRRDLDRTRPLREREPVAPGSVIEPTEVAPDDHSV